MSARDEKTPPGCAAQSWTLADGLYGARIASRRRRYSRVVHGSGEKVCEALSGACRVGVSIARGLVLLGCASEGDRGLCPSAGGRISSAEVVPAFGFEIHGPCRVVESC